MVSFQRRKKKWQLNAFFTLLNLRIVSYSFGLIYSQYQMLKSTVAGSLYGSYGPTGITPAKDMKHVVISVSVVAFIIPAMLKASKYFWLFS